MEAVPCTHTQSKSDSSQSENGEVNGVQMPSDLKVKPTTDQTKTEECVTYQAELDSVPLCNFNKTDVHIQHLKVHGQNGEQQDVEGHQETRSQRLQEVLDVQYETRSQDDNNDLQDHHDQVETACETEHTKTQSQSYQSDIVSQKEESEEEHDDQDESQSQLDEYSQDNQFDEEHNQYQEAEEIVRKLCKNGKVMQFQEGDDFIKVIVYEDSEETGDLEETLSAEETDEGAAFSEERKQAELDSSKNLMDCLLASQRENIQSSEDFNSEAGPGPCKRSRSSVSPQGQILEVHADSNAQVMQHNTQWYQGMLTPTATTHSATCTPASAIQSNFAHTVSQFAPSFLTCNVADLDPVGTAMKPPEHMGKEKPRMFTPHPRNGYMYYVPEETSGTEGLSRAIPLASSSSGMRSQGPNATPRFGKTGMMSQSSINLNSSGEENVSPKEFEDTPTTSRGHQQQQQLPKKLRSLIQYQDNQMEDLGKIREQHNQKERKRRARIKEACNLLRQLVPGMSDKTDKATVFEFAARYVHFLKSHTGTQFDKDFLMKYSPY